MSHFTTKITQTQVKNYIDIFKIKNDKKKRIKNEVTEYIKIKTN